MNIEYNVKLDHLNTFGMKVSSAAFSILKVKEDCEAVKRGVFEDKPIVVLGGGSNMLFTGDLNCWMVKNEINGIELLEENDKEVFLRIGAGELWHNMVLYAIENNYAGIENMALIPGTVGAAPIQNIGAYGVEVKQFIKTVHYWDIDGEQWAQKDNAACAFGYRDSIFKHDLKGKVIITAVDICLNKEPKINSSYGNINAALTEAGISDPSIGDVANAVIGIRKAKLPDPAVVGNAGSFFKNPEVPNAIYEKIKLEFPSVPGYVVSSEFIKIPAAWLIEQCGWKGFRTGDAGVHPLQPLVLVNYGGADGNEILQLSTNIINSIYEKFGITLEREVQIF